MGMDLKPVKPTKHYPRDEDGNAAWGRYNIFGWDVLQRGLIACGLDVELPQSNDGDLIPAMTCKKIADTIEKNHHLVFSWVDLSDIKQWRFCGGFRVL